VVRFLVLAVVLLPTPAFAQTPLRFKWTAGDRLAFNVSHETTITETAPLQKDGKPETTTTTTKLTIGKRWDVKAVDAAGTATMTLTITAMKQEIAKPVVGKDGKVLTDLIVMDSATPEGAKEMAEYLNKPILTAKIDARGGVSEVASTGGDTAKHRLQAELPFRVLLPEAAVAEKGTWDRAFSVKLDPPLGTGESHDATQTHTLRGVNNGYAVIAVATAFKNPPTAAADLQPLVPWLWEGDVFVHAQTGKYAGAKLKAAKTIPNHAGEGTKFVFASEYTEAVGK
jgi:hypothetical protein